MESNRGLATIPLILGIVLLVIAVPVAVLLVQQNQNTQNRAYEVAPIGSVDCTQILDAKIKYCSSVTAPSPSGVPCSEIDSAIATYCFAVSPTPKISPIVNCIPRPACLDATPACKMPEPVGGWCSIKPTSTPSVRCTTGQTKCTGRILFKCTNNQWNLSQTCSVSCLNGVCIGGKTIGPPVIQPIVR